MEVEERVRAGKICIVFVKTMEGGTTSVEWADSETVYDLMERIEEHELLGPGEYRLLRAGKALDEGKSVSHGRAIE